MIVRQDWYRVRLLLHTQTLDEIAAGYFKGQMTGAQLAVAMQERTEHERMKRAGRDYRSPKTVKIKNSKGQTIQVKYIPDHVLEDRERRQNAPETLGSIYFGDPTTPRWMSNADSRAERLTCGIGYISRFF